MDPEAALARAEQALRDENIDEVISALEDYWSWREKGGYEPEGGDSRARAIGNRLHSASRGPRVDDAFIRGVVTGLLVEARSRVKRDDFATISDKLKARLVVHVTDSTGKFGTTPWSVDFGEPDEENLTKYATALNLTRAILSDPVTGQVFVRWKKEL